MKKELEYAKEAVQKKICERLGKKPDTPFSYREKKSLQMKAMWEGIRKAEKEGHLVVDIGPAIKEAAAAVKDFTKNPVCPLPKKPEGEQKEVKAS